MTAPPEEDEKPTSPKVDSRALASDLRRQQQMAQPRRPRRSAPPTPIPTQTRMRGTVARLENGPAYEVVDLATAVAVAGESEAVAEMGGQYDTKELVRLSCTH